MIKEKNQFEQEIESDDEIFGLNINLPFKPLESYSESEIYEILALQCLIEEEAHVSYQSYFEGGSETDFWEKHLWNKIDLSRKEVLKQQ